MGRSIRNHSTTSKTPKVMFERERFDRELRLAGVYGLKCKTEIYRVHTMLGKLRSSARMLLMREESDVKRQLQGASLLRKLHRLGILPSDQDKLEFVLALKEENILDRRLQTIVHKKNLARSVHHARILILQKMIRVGKQVVNSPSFLVRVDSENQVQYAENTPITNPEIKGRVQKKNIG